MKKYLFASIAMIMLSANAAHAEKVRDWQDLKEAHNHVQQAIHEMEKARAANHYDMAGHGEKAEQLLRDAEKELKESIEAAKKAK